MDPAVAAHGELVFSSPVPKAGRLWTSGEPAQPGSAAVSAAERSTVTPIETRWRVLMHGA